VKGDRKPAPDTFLKKHTGTMGNETLPPRIPYDHSAKNFSYDCKHKKDSVPKAGDQPVHGLKSNKNFIVTNAIENILSNPKQTEDSIDWLKKSDFGKTPDYLNRIKENIQGEYRMIQNLHERNSDQKYPFSYPGKSSPRKKCESSEKDSNANGMRSTRSTRRPPTSDWSIQPASSEERKATRSNSLRSRLTSRSSTNYMFLLNDPHKL
jgi:hypothetical protein